MLFSNAGFAVRVQSRAWSQQGVGHAPLQVQFTLASSRSATARASLPSPSKRLAPKRRLDGAHGLDGGAVGEEDGDVGAVAGDAVEEVRAGLAAAGEDEALEVGLERGELDVGLVEARDDAGARAVAEVGRGGVGGDGADHDAANGCGLFGALRASAP